MILVHLHIHYHEQAGYFIGKLRNITVPDWHLTVTWNREDKDTRDAILAFKPDAEFIMVENVGFDIWPFIKVIGTAGIERYDYIIKLHTKGPSEEKCRINGTRLPGYRWRDTLVEPLLGSPGNFQRMDEIFRTEPCTGLVCSAILYTQMKFREDGSLLEAEMERLGIRTSERRFCVGTIFAIRPQALKPLLDCGLSAGDFPSFSRSHSGDTKAHVFERILSILPSSLGYETHTVGATRALKFRLAYGEKAKKIFEWIFSLNRIGEDYIKYLTIFGIRIRLEN